MTNSEKRESRGDRSCSLVLRIEPWIAMTVCLLWVLPVNIAAQSESNDRVVATQAQDRELRVMSFNIRFGTANDGDNHWNQRREFLVETIRAFQPDLLGTQETLAFQRDYLAEQLVDYDHLGVGRDDGKERGEMMAIYWKRDCFEKLDSGHFWLSESPEVVASKSWDTSLPRMVTWVKLRDRRRTDAVPLVWFNTHFDHRGEQARLESAKLLRKKILAAAADSRIIVTGDFNAGEGSPPYAALFAPAETGQPQIIDAYRQHQPQSVEHEGTFSGFDAKATSGARIDWVAVCDRWQIISAVIDRTQKDGRTPSDHFPINVVLR
ncbi:MAG: endonuclease/exonuclease/phosphatase family protein [Planctomycetaceae bacterium]|nr:endonuclease/exonuclease/phosphatase family protein [Planctomycetaceae bacterium]